MNNLIYPSWIVDHRDIIQEGTSEIRNCEDYCPMERDLFIVEVAERSKMFYRVVEGRYKVFVDKVPIGRLEELVEFIKEDHIKNGEGRNLRILLC